MISKSSNKRVLVISSKSSVRVDLTDWVPYIVVLTAWTIDRSSLVYWKSLIDYLLEKGVVYIACFGTFSEKLHDEIDELIYEYDDAYDKLQNVNIVTTFHANDTIEEAIDYCLYGTELEDKAHNCILVILDEGSIEDQEVKEFLLKS